MHAQDLTNKNTFGFIKVKNASLRSLQFSQNGQLIFVATKEGPILVFDCRERTPLMIHVIKVKQINKMDYISQIDFDPETNGLFARSKLGTIYYFIMILKQSSQVHCIEMETIDSYKNAVNKDVLTEFKHMPRMQSYVEGTRLGYMKIRSPHNNGESLLHLQTGFTDKVAMLHYNAEKNVLFAASKDGQFRVWKIPHEWKNRSIYEKQKEANYKLHVRQKQ